MLAGHGSFGRDPRRSSSPPTKTVPFSPTKTGPADAQEIVFGQDRRELLTGVEEAGKDSRAWGCWGGCGARSDLPSILMVAQRCLSRSGRAWPTKMIGFTD